GTPAPSPSPSPQRPRATVFLDPGHGGVDEGGIGALPDGTRVYEKDVTLAIARLAAERLRADGFAVVLSREDDSLPGLAPSDLTPDGQSLTAEGALRDLQRRIDRANASGAAVLLSIHFNWFDDSSVRGGETFYDSTRTFGAANRRLADLVQRSVIDGLRAAGYQTPDRGVVDDTRLEAGSLGALPASYNHLVMLGPDVPGKLRASRMPGVLSEPLFLSNPAAAAAATDPATQRVIADAYARAIETFLAEQGK
ncbi:MAG: N-acetylmuramoyl-L-alanine amidase, partial [Thermomicrobiaceae bacterium]|nr:N-acetylmuramoyl-L-alanine amidase [Thermomicrobiaceae bacterium]